MGNLIQKLYRENRGLLLFIALMLVFRSSIADWSDVPTGSMKPTIQEGDRIVIDKLAYDLRIPFTQIVITEFSDPQPGDIVVFNSTKADKRLVKRVIGTPGDKVKLANNRLFLNNRPFEYSLVTTSDNHSIFTEQLEKQTRSIRVDRVNGFDSFETATVPEDHYLVLGDNRNNSMDSRYYGFVPREEIIGRATKIAFSLDYENHFLPRWERTNTPLI